MFRVTLDDLCALERFEKVSKRDVLLEHPLVSVQRDPNAL